MLRSFRPSFLRTPESRRSFSANGPGTGREDGGRSCKLTQKAQVILEEQAQIIDAVTQHREALAAHAEREAGVAFRIDVAGAQHVRMDHAAAEHLEPRARAILAIPADIDFGAGLDEREIARPETHLEIALEERTHESGERALEIGEADVLADQQALGQPPSLPAGASLALRATDQDLTENTWTVIGSAGGVHWHGQPASADLALSGPATDLLLALLRRQPAEETGISMQGDTALWHSWLALTPL